MQPNKLQKSALFRIEQLQTARDLFFVFVGWVSRFDDSPERIGFFPDLLDHGFVLDGVFAEARELFPQRLNVRQTLTLVDALHSR
jgi:hypothetical protein